jgi:hypothetical protein
MSLPFLMDPPTIDDPDVIALDRAAARAYTKLLPDAPLLAVPHHASMPAPSLLDQVPSVRSVRAQERRAAKEAAGAKVRQSGGGGGGPKDAAARLEQRRLKNRECARAARERKKRQWLELQRRNELLMSFVTKQYRVMKALREENRALRLQLAQPSASMK